MNISVFLADDQVVQVGLERAGAQVGQIGGIGAGDANLIAMNGSAIRASIKRKKRYLSDFF